MQFIVILLLIIIPVVNMLLGLFIFFRPASAIEIQKKFYEKINWRVEPISMKKELRNTKIMALVLIAVTIGTAAYILILTHAA